MKTVEVTLTITYDEAKVDAPEDWYWEGLLDLGPDESIEVVGVIHEDDSPEAIQSLQTAFHQVQLARGDLDDLRQDYEKNFQVDGELDLVAFVECLTHHVDNASHFIQETANSLDGLLGKKAVKAILYPEDSDD